MKCYSVFYYPIITVLCIKGNNRIMYKGKQSDSEYKCIKLADI